MRNFRWLLKVVCANCDPGALGHLDAANAELAKARAVLGDNGAYLYARIYAQWGQAPDALRWLATAYQLRDPGLIEMRIDPALDPMRGAPEYRKLVKQLGFPPV